MGQEAVGREKRKICCRASTDRCKLGNVVIGSENPVLVEFWAPGCGPSRMITPVIDQMAAEYAGLVARYEVNIDDCPNIASQHGIISTPTVMLFRNGEKKESVIGAVPKATLAAIVEKHAEI